MSLRKAVFADFGHFLAQKRPQRICFGCGKNRDPTAFGPEVPSESPKQRSRVIHSLADSIGSARCPHWPTHRSFNTRVTPECPECPECPDCSECRECRVILATGALPHRVNPPRSFPSAVSGPGSLGSDVALEHVPSRRVTQNAGFQVVFHRNGMTRSSFGVGGHLRHLGWPGVPFRWIGAASSLKLPSRAVESSTVRNPIRGGPSRNCGPYPVPGTADATPESGQCRAD